MRLGSEGTTQGQGGGVHATPSAVRFDVLVVGSDVAGLALALRLAHSGWRIGLLEPDEDPASPASPDRVAEGDADDELLPAGSIAHLLRLGLSASWLGRIATPSPGLLAFWGEDGHRAFADHPLESGWCVDSAELKRQLLRRAEAAGIERLARGRIDARQRLERLDGWLLRVRHESAIQVVMARYLIDATGLEAELARQLGVRPVEQPPVTQITLDCCTHEAAPDTPLLDVIEAVPAGWWHAHGGRPAGVRLRLTTDADLFAGDGADGASRVAQAMRGAPAVEQRFEMVVRVDRVRVRQWAPRRLASPVGPGWLAVGAACAAGDPLVASRLEWALRSAELAQACLLRAGGGDAAALPAYGAAVARVWGQWTRQREALYAAAAATCAGAFWQRRRPAPAVWRARRGRRHSAVAGEPVTADG